MRINVYSEEITGEVDFITKDDVLGEDGSPTTFYGLRVYLDSSNVLHKTEFDDDRSAVTFWAKTKSELYGLAVVLMNTLTSEA